MQREEVSEIIKKENVKFLQMQFMDIIGAVKTVIIPSSKFDKAMDDGVLFDGSSVLGYTTIDESDMRGAPDLNTFLILPWYHNGKTARIICDVYTSSGERFVGDPRYALQKMLSKASKLGYTFATGPEFEFFLFKLNEKNEPTVIPNDHGGYFDYTPIDQAEEVKKKILEYLDMIGYDPEAAHHEASPGQHEIDLRFSDALTTADRIMTLKAAIKTIALEHGLFASFMPKPIYGVNGSGMHVHQSLMSLDRKSNVFYDENAKYQLSETAMHYLGGLLKYSREIVAVLSSSVNSYKRLVPGYEAPVYITWANKNRSALVRVPAGSGLKKRLELRNPDPAGNPYLQFAVMLGAGLKGIEEKIEPPAPVEKNIYKLTKKEREDLGIDMLPGSLGEALEFMERSTLIKETLGDHIFEHFLHVKRKEWEEYRSEVTEWEIRRLLPIL
ncbi:MAG: type I glutamate--ammonia ligase [Thermoplasmata archaeon]